ncbi:MAG: nucleoside 2-deoxyribosyltransferase [Nanoarchaeota archaeon]
MKVYIAGKLQTESERESLEEIDALCKSLDLKTFLPHRDVGLAKDMNDVEKIFKGDILTGFKNCKLVVALLNGLHVGSGTAWELGYAYAKGIPIIGLKTDESIEEALEYLSAILIYSIHFASSMDELKIKIKEILKLK